MFEQYNDVVTIKELCQMLQIGRNTAYDLVNSNRIKSIRVGRKFLIPKAHIISYLTVQCVQKDLQDNSSAV